jgi:hypothetical protein
MGTNDHSTAFQLGSERRSGAQDIREILREISRHKTPITFYSYMQPVSAKLVARQNPVGHSRTRLCPWSSLASELKTKLNPRDSRPLHICASAFIDLGCARIESELQKSLFYHVLRNIWMCNQIELCIKLPFASTNFIICFYYH